MAIWKDLSGTIEKVGSANGSPQQKGNLVTQLLNTMHAHDTVTQTISAWCDVSSTFLEAYIQDVKESTLLVSVLDDGLNKIGTTIPQFDDAGMNLKKTTETLTIMLKEPLNSSEEFYRNLKVTVDQAANDIQQTKGKVNDKLQKIRDVKSRLAGAETFASADDVIKSAQNMIDNCNAYRKKHSL